MKSQRALSFLASLIICSSAVADTTPLDPRIFYCHPNEADLADFSKSAEWYLEQYEDRIELSKISIVYKPDLENDTLNSKILWLVGNTPDFVLKNSVQDPMVWESNRDESFFYRIELPSLIDAEAPETVILERRTHQTNDETDQLFNCWSSR